MTSKLVDLTKADTDIEKASERVTIWMKMKMVNEFRELAKAEGIGYQTLMKQALQEYLVGDRPDKSSMQAMSIAMRSLSQKVLRLEHEVRSARPTRYETIGPSKVRQSKKRSSLRPTRVNKK